jgi:phosphonate C-P lyase system protein PhnH
MKSKHEFDMVQGCQEVFRLLLDALANPGRPVNLGGQINQFSANGQWLAPALTFLDNECGFFWDGGNETGEEIRFLSGASQEGLENADFIFLSSKEVKAENVLSKIKSGTHRDPHKSALIFVEAGGKQEKTVLLKGPGIPPEGRNVLLSQTEAQWIKARDELKFEYPCGVEIIFMRDDHSYLAITRKAAASWPM